MRIELKNPKKFLPDEKFTQLTKFALIVCNEFYDKKYTTLDDLPDVIEDFKSAKHTCKMMGIHPDNTFEFKDVSH